jgi:hypothetical protein
MTFIRDNLVSKSSNAHFPLSAGTARANCPRAFVLATQDQAKIQANAYVGANRFVNKSTFGAT